MATAVPKPSASGAPLKVFDCTSELMNPEAADRLYAQVHIAGAMQAHLDRNLSAPSAADAVNGGRHPLPRRELFAEPGTVGTICRDIVLF